MNYTRLLHLAFPKPTLDEHELELNQILGPSAQPPAFHSMPGSLASADDICICV